MDSYPLLNLFWTMLWFFLWIMWLFLLFKVISDIFRSDDLGGWGKAGWLILALVVPYLGVLIYVIARGKSMGKRDVAEARSGKPPSRRTYGKPPPPVTRPARRNPAAAASRNWRNSPS